MLGLVGDRRVPGKQQGEGMRTPTSGGGDVFVSGPVRLSATSGERTVASGAGERDRVAMS